MENLSTQQVDLLRHLKNREVEEAKKILEENVCPVLVRDTHGESPIHWAANTNDGELVQTLIDKGCYVNSENWYRASPLYYACTCDAFESIKVLLDNCADPRTKSGFSGKTALDVCKSEKTRLIMKEALDRHEKAKKNFFVMFKYRKAVFWRVSLDYFLAPNKTNMFMGFQPNKKATELGKKDMKELLKKCYQLDKEYSEAVDSFHEGNLDVMYCLCCSRKHTEDVKLKRCNRCSQVYFCDRKCQIDVWRIHKLDCLKTNK